MRTLLIAMLVLAPLVAAQSSSAPGLSVDVQTLYAHGTGNDEFNGFMNPLIDDGGDAAMGTGDPVADDTQTWVLTMAPPLDRTVMLDGDVSATVYIGGSTHIGEMDVSWALTHGEETVATGASETVTMTPADAGSGPYTQQTWTVPADLAEITPGADLVWTITADGSASAVFIGVGESRGRTNIVLPVSGVILPAPPVSVHYEEIEDLAVDLTFDDVTNNQTQYNWTAPDEPFTISIAGDLTGNATIVMTAAEERFNGTLTGAINETVAGEPGDWTIMIDLVGVQGTLTITVQEPAADGSDGMDGGDGVDGMDGGDGDDGSDGDDGDGGGDKDSPGVGLIVVPLLGLIAWLRRR